MSVCFSGLTPEQKTETIQTLTDIYLETQDELARYYEDKEIERKLKHEKRKKETERMKNDLQTFLQSEQLKETSQLIEFERERQIREREKSMNFGKKRR